ncbi:phage holin family protein [Paenibacillus aestuarii]|uniref:Holin family protein n=1 Tax=Paenibacillus aestuarii TaxID=516965 RepID=A0ABW0KBR9_9BACL|nr:phage holin family protein [Paenibacillus aestuarii]
MISQWLEGLAASMVYLGRLTHIEAGSWEGPLRLLVYLMIADYVMGVLAALKAKQLSGHAMLWEAIRKGGVLSVVCIAAQLDQLLGGGQAPVFRNLAIYFYAGREGLALIEHFGAIGVPWPPAIRNALRQLQKGKDKK